MRLDITYKFYTKNSLSLAFCHEKARNAAIRATERIYFKAPFLSWGNKTRITAQSR